MDIEMNKELNKIVPNKTRKRALTIMYVGLGMNLFGFAAFDPLGSFFENLGDRLILDDVELEVTLIK